MSVVVFDGTSLAADRQAVNGEYKFETSKLYRIDDEVCAFTGNMDSGLAMLRWYQLGRPRNEWPVIQQDRENWSRLIVMRRSVGGPRVEYYDQTPDAILSHQAFAAWGSGRDFALGALARGATAKEAVEIACHFSIYCGMGVDVMELGVSLG